MKKIAKLGALLLAVWLCVACVLPAIAAKFDMDEAIEKTKPAMTKTLSVGEVTSVPSVAWTDVSYYVSDGSVITLNGTSLHAKGEGTAYLAIVSNRADTYVLYCYNVVEESESSAQSGLFGKMDKSDVTNVFSGMSFIFIPVAIVFGIVVLAFILIIASSVASRRLDNAMQQLGANPCDHTAEAAVQAFTHINPIVRWNLSLGSDTRGVHFTLWKHVFNTAVVPSQRIKHETKVQLRAALVRVNTWGLLSVSGTDLHGTTRMQATEKRMDRLSREHARAFAPPKPIKAVTHLSAEEFGQGGEDNVWHNLKTLATRKDIDIYRNVRIRNQSTTSEIDAVVVTEQGGIFLLEIKACGGHWGSDDTKHVAFKDLRENPSNQIIRHQLDFNACFATEDVQACVTNALVISWPHTEDPRVVDMETFTDPLYDVVPLDGLLAYLTTQQKHLERN